MTRLAALWRAWLAGRTYDWPETGPDIGTDDDGPDIDFGEHVCTDPGCAEAKARIRARIEREWYAMHHAGDLDYHERLREHDYRVWDLEIGLPR